MNELKVFENAEFGSVRTVEVNGKVMFCGKDVATALGYKNTADALARHCKEDGVAFHDVTDSLGRTQQAKFVSEGNLYRLVCGSELPNAERFERWVFDEVLPTLHRTGTYTMPQSTQQPQSVTAAEYLEITKSIADWLKVNDTSKITMLKTALSNYNLPTNILPAYTQSKGELLSCTTCLNRIGAKLKVQAFNLLLLRNGYLEERERPSIKVKSGVKKYKVLTEKGLQFGENQVCPNNPRETQPLYYADKFQELYDKVAHTL